MFLSRARLRPDSAVRAIAKLLLPPDGPARMLASHRLVWSLMSDDADRRRDFLWREEQPGGFLILAPRTAVMDGGLFDVESQPWEPNLAAGDRLGFLLRANPTVARSPGRGVRGRRHDVVMDALRGMAKGQRAAARREAIVEAGREWLTRQGRRGGFVLDPGAVRVDGYETVRIAREGGKPVEFGRLEFEGMLEVENPPIFIQAVAGGFGRARAFGCGLMLLRRA
jgi:CRISPR system Cascade subunit CasE